MLLHKNVKAFKGPRSSGFHFNTKNISVNMEEVINLRSATWTFACPKIESLLFIGIAIGKNLLTDKLFGDGTGVQ